MPRSGAVAFQFSSKHPFSSTTSKNFVWFSAGILWTLAEDVLERIVNSAVGLRFGASTMEVCEIDSTTGLRMVGLANEK